MLKELQIPSVALMQPLVVARHKRKRGETFSEFFPGVLNLGILLHMKGFGRQFGHLHVVGDFIKPSVLVTARNGSLQDLSLDLK